MGGSGTFTTVDGTNTTTGTGGSGTSSNYGVNVLSLHAWDRARVDDGGAHSVDE
jgi:hypothetical protein